MSIGVGLFLVLYLQFFSWSHDESEYLPHHNFGPGYVPQSLRLNDNDDNDDNNGKPCLVQFDVCEGLNNQRICIVTGLLISKLLNCNARLPTLKSSYTDDLQY